MFFFLFWNIKNVKVDLMVNVKNASIKCKICTEKRMNTSLKDLSIALNNHGRHGLLSILRSLPISVIRNLELETMKQLTNYIKIKISKGAKIGNRYIQVPHLTQNTNGKVTNSQLDTTNDR